MIPLYDFDTALARLQQGYKMEVVLTPARRSVARIRCASGVIARVKRGVRDRLIDMPELALEITGPRSSVYRWDFSFAKPEPKEKQR